MDTSTKIKEAKDTIMEAVSFGHIYSAVLRVLGAGVFVMKKFMASGEEKAQEALSVIGELDSVKSKIEAYKKEYEKLNTKKSQIVRKCTDDMHDRIDAKKKEVGMDVLLEKMIECQESGKEWKSYHEEFVSLQKKHIHPLIDEVDLKAKEALQGYEDKTDEIVKKISEVEEEFNRGVREYLLGMSSVTQEEADEWVSNQIVEPKASRRLSSNAKNYQSKRKPYLISDVKRDMAEFYRLVNGKIPEVTLSSTRGTRANATVERAIVRVASSFDKRTLFHELAHLLEADPDIKGAANAFLDSRTNNREKVTSLAKITGNRLFHRSERAAEDAFYDPYVGKIYPNGVTEVFSMGLQQFSDGIRMHDLYSRDPGMFNFILGAISNLSVDDDARKEQIEKARKVKESIDSAKQFLKDLDKAAKALPIRIVESNDEVVQIEGGRYFIYAITRNGRKRPSYYTLFKRNVADRDFSGETMRSKVHILRYTYLALLSFQENGDPTYLDERDIYQFVVGNTTKYKDYSDFSELPKLNTEGLL